MDDQTTPDWEGLHNTLAESLTSPEFMKQHPELPAGPVSPASYTDVNNLNGPGRHFQGDPSIKTFTGDVGNAYESAMTKAGAPAALIKKGRQSVEDLAAKRARAYAIQTMKQSQTPEELAEYIPGIGHVAAYAKEQGNEKVIERLEKGEGNIADYQSVGNMLGSQTDEQNRGWWAQRGRNLLGIGQFAAEMGMTGGLGGALGKAGVAGALGSKAATLGGRAAQFAGYGLGATAAMPQRVLGEYAKSGEQHIGLDEQGGITFSEADSKPARLWKSVASNYIDNTIMPGVAGAFLRAGAGGYAARVFKKSLMALAGVEASGDLKRAIAISPQGGPGWEVGQAINSGDPERIKASLKNAAGAMLEMGVLEGVVQAQGMRQKVGLKPPDEGHAANETAKHLIEETNAKLQLPPPANGEPQAAGPAALPPDATAADTAPNEAAASTEGGQGASGASVSAEDPGQNQAAQVQGAQAAEGAGGQLAQPGGEAEPVPQVKGSANRATESGESGAVAGDAGSTGPAAAPAVPGAGSGVLTADSLAADFRGVLDRLNNDPNRSASIAQFLEKAGSLNSSGLKDLLGKLGIAERPKSKQDALDKMRMVLENQAAMRGKVEEIQGGGVLDLYQNAAKLSDADYQVGLSKVEQELEGASKSQLKNLWQQMGMVGKTSADAITDLIQKRRDAFIQTQLINPNKKRPGIMDWEPPAREARRPASMTVVKPVEEMPQFGDDAKGMADERAWRAAHPDYGQEVSTGKLQNGVGRTYYAATGMLSEEGYGKGRPLPDVPTTPQGQVGPRPKDQPVPGQADILKTMDAEFGLDSRTGKTKGELGLHQEMADLVRTMTSNIGVRAHETLHSLDSRFHILDDLDLPHNPRVEAQLLDAADQARQEMLANPNITPTQAKLVNSTPLAPEEGLAEYFRHRLTTGKASFLFDDGPNGEKGADRAFNEFLNATPELKKAVDKVQGLMDVRRTGSALERAKADMYGAGQEPERLQATWKQKLGDVRDGFKDFWTRTVNKYLNDNAAVADLETKGLSKGTKVDKEHGPSAYIRSLRSEPPMWAKDSFENGVHNPETGERLEGPSLVEALAKGGGNTPEGKAELSLYWVHLHRLEEFSRTGKDPVQLGSMEDSKQIVKELGSPERREAVRMLRDYNNNLMQMDVDIGKLAPKEQQAMLKAHPLYAPLKRITDADRATGLKAFAAPKGYQARYGSDLSLMDPIDATVQRTTQAYDAAAKHLALKRMFQFVKKNPTSEAARQLVEIPPDMNAEKYSAGNVAKELEKAGFFIDPADMQDPDLRKALITLYKPDYGADPLKYRGQIMDQGKPRTFEVDKTLHAWADAVPNEVIGPVFDWVANKMASFKKAGLIGLRPGFILSRGLFDTMSHALFRQEGRWYDPAIGLWKSTISQPFFKGNDPFLKEMHKHALEIDPMMDLGKQDTQSMVKDLIASADGRYRITASRAASYAMLGKVANNVGTGFRYGEFRRSLEKQGITGDVLQQFHDRGENLPHEIVGAAINNAKEVFHNYSEMGTFIRKWNKVIPLLGSSIYVVKKPIAAAVQRPATVLGRLAAVNAATGLWALFSNQFDEYKNADRKLKSTHIYVPPFWGGDQGAWLPLGAHGLGAVAAMAGSNAMNSLLEGNTKQLKAYGEHAIAHSLSVPYAPAPISALQGLATNQDYDHSIEPDKYRPGGRQPLPKAERFDPRFTGPLAKAIGGQSWIPGSPAQWQYGLKEATGGLYTRAEKDVENLAEGKVSPSMIPVVGRAFRENPSEPQDVRDQYDRREELTEKANSLKMKGQSLSTEEKREKAKLDAWARSQGKVYSKGTIKRGQ